MKSSYSICTGRFLSIFNMVEIGKYIPLPINRFKSKMNEGKIPSCIR